MSKLKRLQYIAWAVIAIGALLAVMAGWRYVESRRVRPVPILMYHHIGNTADSAWCIPVETFKNQMRDLCAQGFTSILPSDLIAHQTWGKPLPSRPVIITFDDGYLNTITIVEPILKRYGLRGIVYLITKEVSDTTKERRQFEGTDCLAWPEVLAMQERGTIVFGGHSHAHENLAIPDDPSPSIRECYKQLVDHGIKPPYSFCYPYGQYKEQTIKAVRRAGFTTAMVCEDAVANTGPGMNLLALPRVSVMGGRHQFNVSRLRAKEGPAEVIYRVAHEGVPMAVAPQLRINDSRLQPKWLPFQDIGAGQFEWRWMLANAADKQKPFQLEIWDKHRIFQLYVEDENSRPLQGQPVTVSAGK